MPCTSYAENYISVTQNTPTKTQHHPSAHVPPPAYPQKKNNSCHLCSQVGTANFRFPALDPATEAFLWRRKADLDAAIDAMPTTATTAQASASQGVPGRAAADLADARVLAAAGPPHAEGVELLGDNQKRSTVAEPSLSRTGQLRSKERRRDVRNSTVKRRASRGNKGVGAAASAGTAMLAKGKSVAAKGARGLQLAMIEEAFARLDVDGDGYITPGDLGLAFRNMGRDASERR